MRPILACTLRIHWKLVRGWALGARIAPRYGDVVPSGTVGRGFASAVLLFAPAFFGLIVSMLSQGPPGGGGMWRNTGGGKPPCLGDMSHVVFVVGLAASQDTPSCLPFEQTNICLVRSSAKAMFYAAEALKHRPPLLLPYTSGVDTFGGHSFA